MLLALFLVAAAPVAAFATPTPPPAAEVPVRADAVELVRVLNPEGLMADMVVRSFADSMRSVIDGSEDYHVLEKEYPGISEALIEAMSKVMRADFIADQPALRLRYARFYADRFSPDETAQLMRFYSSSAGQRLVKAKFSKLDATPMVGEFVEAPDTQVSKDHIRDLNRAATLSIIGDISREDRATLMEFAKQPVFVKLGQARGAIEQLEAAIANEADPELDKALDAATNAVFLKFTGKPLPGR